MRGIKARVVRRRERRKERESQGQVLRAQMSRNLPPLLLEREEERIAMKIQRVHQKGQEAELRPHHLLGLIRERNLEWLNVRSSLHLTVAGLERGHLLRGKIDGGTGLHLSLQRSKGQLRRTIHLPLLDSNEMEWKRSENAKRHISIQEATREEERGEGREGRRDSLRQMMSR